MKILYVINSPCWTEISPAGLNNSTMFSDELSENFTFFYYNLMKFGLVEKVIIFVENKRWRNDHNIKKKITTKYGDLEIRRDNDKFKVINSDREMNLVFCWSNIEECNKIKNKFIIVDNQFHGYIKKTSVSKDIHDLVLTESENFKKYIPKNIPTYVYKLISYDHEKFQLENKNFSSSKKYDWVMISSFDKRKRHLEFLNSLNKHNLSNLKGCIIARDPDNKKKKFSDFFKKTPWKVFKKVKKLQKKMNFDIFINIHQNEKIELTLNSKIFINSSELDSGPRAQVEAFQLNIPVLSMSHIGASDLIKNNKNGEILNNIDEMPNKLKIMLDNYDLYSLKTFENYLRSDLFMPDLVENIKLNYEKKLNG
jgi:glycosyltransferase involved in cell wall biosynthesis